MGKILFRILLLIGLSAAPLSAAKNCPSRLSSFLHPVGDAPFFWAVELRGFDHLVDGLNYTYFGIGGWLRFEASENLSLDLEAVYRPKRYGDCREAEDLSPFQLRTFSLNASLEGPAVDIRLGRQEIIRGSGLVLNDFFDAVSTEASLFGVDVSAGAGILALPAAKESLYCQKCFFYEYRSGWKGLCRSEYGDYGMAYIDLTGSPGKRHRLGLLYMKTWAVEPGFSSHTLSVHGNWRLPGRVNLFTELATQRPENHTGWVSGWHVEAIRSFRIKRAGSLTLRAGSLFGQARGRLLFTPVFGNLYLGDRQHYSVRQGHILSFRARFTPVFFKAISLDAAYFSNPAHGLADPVTDEFDLGMEARLPRSEKFRIRFVYSRSMTPSGPVHQARIDTRINL